MNNIPKKPAGFTIIELMVALTIAAVMMAFALPAFNDFIAQREMTTNVNAMVSAVNYARSEATRIGSAVSVQALDAADNDNEWGPGFCVTEGDPGNCDAALQTFSMAGTITFDGVGGLQAIDSLTYNSRGLLQGGALGTIELCGADADADPGRVITINAVGRASVLAMVCYP